MTRTKRTINATPADVAEFDRQRAAIKKGKPAVARDEVVRGPDPWGTHPFASFSEWSDRADEKAYRHL